MQNEPRRLGVHLVNTLFSFDDEFVKLRLTGKLTAGVLDDWAALVNGGPDIDYYAEMMRSLKGIDAQDPISACIAGVRAYLAWAAAVANGVVRHPAKDGTWQTVVARLLRSFTRAGVYWAPQELALGAVDYLRGTSEYLRHDEITTMLVDEMAWELGTARRRLTDRLGELAFDLQERLADDEARAGVSALFWTMGDVARAEALRRGTYQPSRPRLKRLVTDSFRRIPVDPLVQAVWIFLDSLLGEIEGLHCRIAYGNPDHTFEQICRLYTSTLVDRCLNPPTKQDLRALTSAMVLYGGEIGDSHPAVWVRIVALIKSESPGVDGLPSWPELVAKAAKVVQSELGMAVDTDEYDVSPGISAHYLSEDPVRTLETIENYRSSTLWYWRHLHPDGKSDERRRMLRDRVRGARYAQSVLHLPGPRRHLSGTHLDWAPGRLSQLVAGAAEPEHLARLGSELAALAADNPADPSADRPASIMDFAAALKAR